MLSYRLLKSCSKFNRIISMYCTDSALKTEPLPHSYEAAVAALNALQSNAATRRKAAAERGIDVGQYNIVEATDSLRRLGISLADLDRLNVVHIAGSKGKGSTCAYVESILRAHGRKTGFYSSPHLVHVTERIRLDGAPIARDLFAQYFWVVYKRLQDTLEPNRSLPAYFNFLTTMAYYIFVKEKVDVAVVEVGIGGLSDSTNVFQNPLICAVTTLDYDHQAILGDTLSEIAVQKAGIFKPGCIALTSVSQESDCVHVLETKANERGSQLYLCPDAKEFGWSNEHNWFEHQSINIGLALEVTKFWLQKVLQEGELPEVVVDEDGRRMVKAFELTPQFVRGVEQCSWPGRNQVVHWGAMTFFIDGAHTPKSMQCCANWFQAVSSRALNGNKRPLRVLIFNCTADRSPSVLLEHLSACEFDVAAFCPNLVDASFDISSDQTNLLVSPSVQLDRCVNNEEAWLKVVRKRYGDATATKIFPCVRATLDWLVDERANRHVEVLVTGSLHLVGAVLSLIDDTLK